MGMFDLRPCRKCGGDGVERIGQGFEHFLCGIAVGHSYGNYVWCRKCGNRTDAYDEPWKAIRAWNGQKMVYDLEDA